MECGNVTWEDCIRKKLVKKVSLDKSLINSLMELSEDKENAQDSLSDKFSESKVSLQYDSLRILLEVLTLTKGYKVYNHECYVYFLKNILNKSLLADDFNEFRKLRNSINYYGKRINNIDAEMIIKKMKSFIKEIRGLISNV